MYGLKKNLTEQFNPDCEGMTFYELPFLRVEEFDYPAIAKMIEDDGADIIWMALGAPKQEQFMARLNPYLKRGVQIAVGEAFKFYSGTGEKYAPRVLHDAVEELHVVLHHPLKKQLKRCWGIVSTLPGMLWREWKRKRASAEG
ncbi:MAG: WecB/TagA/CpsF family glycosyltransferase [Prevotellaceae bacterium]|nr:WecB/TagA/CpsF family glycosyltransferase [Prevotellaceae bacterium]